MVRTSPKERGALTTELIVAMGMLMIAMMPLAFSFPQEQRQVRSFYQRAVAMELIDGEMEILMAGEWRAFKEGTQPYPLQGESARNLPPGKAQLTITGRHVRLEWMPEKKASGGRVVREADAK